MSERAYSAEEMALDSIIDHAWIAEAQRRSMDFVKECDEAEDGDGLCHCSRMIAGLLRTAMVRGHDIAARRAREESGERIEGWAAMGMVSWEFAADDGNFTPGPDSIRATLILHTGEPTDG